MSTEVIAAGISSFLAALVGLFLIAVQRWVDQRRERDRERRDEIDRARTAIFYPAFRLLTQWGQGDWESLHGHDRSGLVALRDLLVRPERVAASRHFSTEIRALDEYLRSAEYLANWVSEVEREPGGKLSALRKVTEGGQDWTRSHYYGALLIHAGGEGAIQEIPGEINALALETTDRRVACEQLRAVAIDSIRRILTPEIPNP